MSAPVSSPIHRHHTFQQQTKFRCFPFPFGRRRERVWWGEVCEEVCRCELPLEKSCTAWQACTPLRLLLLGACCAVGGGFAQRSCSAPKRKASRRAAQPGERRSGVNPTNTAGWGREGARVSLSAKRGVLPFCLPCDCKTHVLYISLLLCQTKTKFYEQTF